MRSLQIRLVLFSLILVSLLLPPQFASAQTFPALAREKSAHTGAPIESTPPTKSIFGTASERQKVVKRGLRPTRLRKARIPQQRQSRKIRKSRTLRVTEAKIRKPKSRKQRSRTSRKTAKPKTSLTARVNNGRVGLISGGIGGTYIRIATDLASVLNDGNTMRILPIVGQGSVQNITDILYLRGVDVGIVQSDVLEFIKARGLHRNIDRRIQYITKLYNEEFHIVGGREIKDIRDLEGKAVNFGVSGSGTHMTATTVFEKLGIDVRPVNHDQALAIEKIRTGEIAATVFVAGKPTGAVSALKGDYGLRLIPVPYDRELQGTYLPARFTSDDYPDLIPSGATVNSIAVGAVMAVYNWSSDHSRRKRVSRFVEAFFSRIEDFRAEPRHKKWREVNLAATLPGWKRFPAAKRWLTENVADGDDNLQVSFRSFLDQTSSGEASTLSGQERNDLFKKFIEWQKSRP